MKTILFALFVLLFGFVRSQTKLTKTYDTICSQTNTSKIFLCKAINNDIEATFKWKKKAGNSFNLINEKDSLIVDYSNLNQGNNLFICETTIADEIKSDTFKLYVNPDPMPTFSKVEPLCIGSTLKVLPKISTNGISGSWLPAFDNTKTTTYTFTPSYANCASTTLTITINPAVVGNTSGKATSICTNTSTILTGSNVTGGSDSYSYLWESSSNDITWITAAGTSNAQNYTTESLTANTYFRRKVTSGGCTDVASSVLVTVNPVISGNTSGTVTSICTNTSTILTGGTVTGGSGAYSYLWESSSNNSIWLIATGTSNAANYSTASLTANTYFRRKVTSGGCTDVAKEILVTVTPLINGNTIGENTTICAGNSTILTGGKLTGGDVVGSFIYKWESSTNNTTWKNAEGTFNLENYNTVQLNESTYFRRTVNSGACKDIAPSVLIIVTPSIKGNTSGLNTSICLGSQLILKGGVVSGGDGNYIYKWESSTNNSTWSPANGINNLVNYTNEFITNDIYFRRTVFSGVCTSVAEQVFLKVNLNPKVDLGTDKIICKGDSISLSTKIENDIDYLWNNNYNKNKIVVKDSGIYKLTAKNNKTSCTNSDSIHITVSDPKSKIVSNGLMSFCQGKSVVLNVPLDSKSSYKWFRNQNQIPGAISNENEVYSSGIYKVQIIDSVNCVGLDSVKVTVNPLPNIPTIFGKSELCSSSLNQQYTTNPTSNKLIWKVEGADIYSGQSTDKLYINIHSKDSIKIDLTEQDLNTGCSSSNSIIVRINSKYISPSLVPVVPMGSNNDFLAAPKVVDVIRWGKINKTNNEVTYYSSKNIYMDFTKIDTSTYFYFVDHGISDECFTRSYYIYPEIVVGFENLSEISVNIFPNPTHSTLNIECEDLNVKDLLIQNTEGKTIIVTKFSKSIVLDVQDLNTGLYFLKIKSNNKVVNYKFSKI